MSTSDKVGSNPDAAKDVAGEGDFGVSAANTEGDRMTREYVSGETRKQDPGHGTTRSHDNDRTSGVGGNDSGPGSSSGGDLDVGGTARTGVADPNQHAPHAAQTAARPGDRPVLDQPVTAADPTRSGAYDGASSTSADGMNNETQHDDNAFKGDVTMDEASGNSSK